MTSAPSVSVVVPTFNRRELVGEAIESVLAQSFRDFELIVVDDGSTDGTQEVLRERFGDDRRLRLFSQDNAGSAAARNFGVLQAEGTWVAYLDSDDVWLPGHLESQLACAASHPEADLVICDARYEGGWKRDGSTVFERNSWRTPNSIDAMCNGAWALPSCMLLRANVAKQLPWDGTFKFAEDTAFLFQFNEHGYACVENRDVLTIYRKHDGLGGEQQKVDARDKILLDHLALLEAFASRAKDPSKVRYQIDRKKARYFARHGRWREARPHAWRWLRARPTSRRALRFAFRSLFSRANRNGAPLPEPHGRTLPDPK